jgi:hypothetical protein
VPRIAVYECPCCAGRVSVPVEPGRRPATRLRCEGWCVRCDGSCRDFAHRVAVERDEAPAVAAPQEIRVVRPSRRLDLPDFRLPDRPR